jgi:subtilisin-like proprotein convertase family protein
MIKQRASAGAFHKRFFVLILIAFIGFGFLLGRNQIAPVRAQQENQLAPDIVVFSESFDGVTAPALPAGWTTATVGQVEAFRTVTTFPDSPPNSVFTSDPNTEGMAELVSPAIALGNLQHKLRFRHFYQLDFEFDGGVLEISINGGGFVDIVTAGGTFLTGGYDTTIQGGQLTGRRAWTGQLAGYVVSELFLPANTAGQSVRFRWRMGTDPMEAGTGWRIDGVEVTNAISGTNSNAISIPTNGTASQYPSEITVNNLTGLVTDVQVSLTNFSHTSPDDVDLMLVAPNGTRVVLMSDVGGANPVTNLSLLFSDAASSSLPDSGLITSGNYKPTNFEAGDNFPAPAPAGAPTGARLSALNGSPANGTWQLFLVDDNGGNAGSINGGWTLFVQNSVDAIAIPETGAAQPYASEKTVLGVQGTITRVTATLSNFSHTSPDDVDVMLVAPNGRSVVLMSDVGGNTEVGGLNITFDDLAVGSLPDNGPLSSGTAKPTNFEPGDVFPAPAPQTLTGSTLAAFYGSAPTGVWKLFVVDDNGANAGSIAGSWTINLQTSTTACSFSLTPSEQAFPITGGSGNFGIVMPSNCSWAATTNSNFITINSSATGNGDGSVSFSVAPNTGGGRSGSIEVSNGVITRTFQVQQPSGSARKFDFDGDSKADVSVYRPSLGHWYISNSSNSSFRAVAFGTNGDQIVPGDFDGDTKTDTAVWRPSAATWYVLYSSDASIHSAQFGSAGDIPATGDYDRDGKSDFCVFRPSAGTFYVLYSSDSSVHAQQWGVSEDLPLMGDYDGDSKTDFAVFRPSSSSFYVLRSSDGGLIAQQWGTTGDKPLAADFDGDNKTDIAVYRPSTGAWYYLQSSDNGFRGIAWGSVGDIPAAADYDGDGKWDLGVFRPSSGTFYILQSTTNTLRGEQFGSNGDVPVASAYVH